MFRYRLFGVVALCSALFGCGGDQSPDSKEAVTASASSPDSSSSQSTSSEIPQLKTALAGVQSQLADHDQQIAELNADQTRVLTWQRDADVRLCALDRRVADNATDIAFCTNKTRGLEDLIEAANQQLAQQAHMRQQSLLCRSSDPLLEIDQGASPEDLEQATATLDACRRFREARNAYYDEQLDETAEQRAQDQAVSAAIRAMNERARQNGFQLQMIAPRCGQPEDSRKFILSIQGVSNGKIIVYRHNEDKDCFWHLQGCRLPKEFRVAEADDPFSQASSVPTPALVPAAITSPPVATPAPSSAPPLKKVLSPPPATPQ